MPLFIARQIATRSAGTAGCCAAMCSSTGTTRATPTSRPTSATFRAEKRKKIRRERRRCAEAGIHFDTLHGGELDAGTAASSSTPCMRAPSTLHGHEPYLNLAFFTRDRADAGRRADGEAGAAGQTNRWQRPCSSWSDDALYGRYWGAIGDFHSLHFEACYHQGIEFCIEHGLARFEPGTQGEHKVVRGFVPSHTWSAHYIADPRFRDAIADFLAREAAAVDAYADDVAAHVPFRRDMKRITWLQPRRSAGRVSRRCRRRWTIRRACWPAAAICPRHGCWPPIRAASFPGIRPASRCCGGHRIRARCCFRRNSMSRAACARCTAPRRIPGHARTGISPP